MKAHWWSRNGKKLAFASYDNTHVDQMPIVVYGVPTGYSDNISRDSYMASSLDPDSAYYPKVISYPYPKPGRKNPVVRIRVADLSAPIVQTKQVVPPKEISSL